MICYSSKRAGVFCSCPVQKVPRWH